MTAAIKTVEVAAGIILNSSRDRVLLSWRLPNLDQGGLWEYPGGKVEPMESPDKALVRELKEELAIQALEIHPLDDLSYDYGSKVVRLHFFVVTDFAGVPTALEGQPLDWCPVTELEQRDFPAANRQVASKLSQWLLAGS